MYGQLRRGIAIVLVYAMALHGVLTALAPSSVSATAFDPTTVTCLHIAGLAGDEAPTNAPAPTSCDHCVLCTAVAPPAGPANVVWILAPTRHSSVRLDLSASPLPTRLVIDRTRLRGPPHTL